MLFRRSRCRLWNVRKSSATFGSFFLQFTSIFFGGNDVAEDVGLLPQRLWWIHPMNKIHGLPGKGEFHAQIQELKSYPDQFLGYFQMPMHKYFEQLNLLKNNRNI